MLERKTFSAISKHEYDVMCEQLNLTATGTIEFAEADVLLGDISILDSFKEQIKLVSHVNVSGVRILCQYADKINPLDRNGMSS